MSCIARTATDRRSPFFEPLEIRRLLAADFVIHISVDGLRPDAVTQLGPSQLPNFYRLRTGGSITDNARTDYDYTITLPNHTDMVTGRPVVGTGGHNWTVNTDPAANQTIHSNKGSYVTSVWDLVHDAGLRTALYATKTKFSLYDSSYDADTTNLQGGAADPNPTGGDNGRDKIDTYLYNASSAVITDSFIAAEAANPFSFAMLHYHDPDTAGHANGWMTTAYLNAVKAVDVQLGKVLDLVQNNPTTSGRTVVTLTADHGGNGTDHSNNADRLGYTIPFYAWGPGAGVDAGGDLYSINAATRTNPGTGRPTYSQSPQPIRNGDAANLALDLLGLPTVPGSFFNSAQNLGLTAAGAPPAVSISASAPNATEAGTPGEFTVMRTGDTSADLVVRYAVSGTATNGLDYGTLSGTATIPAGSASTVFSVSPIEDALNEGNETVVAAITADAAYGVGSPSSATVTIADNDVPPAPPAAPSSLTARAVSRSQIDLAWVDNSGNEDGFEIEYSTNGTTWSRLTLTGPNARSFSATGLAANTRYYFRVRAFEDVLGVSAWSNTVNVKTKR
jgi:Type I phosphodiesterase / nucleotide pyrophosphatase/Fibronectin type III domain